MSLGDSDIAFQSSPPSSSSGRPAFIGALVIVGEFALEALELAVGQNRALRPGIDQRAGRPRRIVEQRLVPRRGGIVRVHRDGRRLQRGQAVMIVERMKQRQMQDRRQRARSGRTAPSRRRRNSHRPPPSRRRRARRACGRAAARKARAPDRRSPPLRRRRCRRSADARRASRTIRRRPGADSAAPSDRAADGRRARRRPRWRDTRTTPHSRRQAAPRDARWRSAHSPRAPAPRSRAASSARSRRIAAPRAARRGEVLVSGARRRFFRRSNMAYPLVSKVYSPRTRGCCLAPKVSAVTAHTSASSRSGERPDDSPSRPKSHISSSSAGNAPTCFTLPCS